MESRSTLWYRSVKERNYSSRGRQCQVDGCKVTDITLLEMAHVKPTKLKGSGRGSCKRASDWIRHKKSYLLLCEEHHEMFDDGKPIVVNHLTYQKEEE